MYTVEDYIELLAEGVYSSDKKFNIERSDVNLIASFAKQTARGIGFTDRQYELAKTKLISYKEQLDKAGHKDIEDVFDNLRIPLRSIDRTRYISIVNMDTECQIAVRFTFQKKLISALEAVKKTIKVDSEYDKENKIHYFPYSEYNLYTLVSIFKDKNFDLDETVKEIYSKIEILKAEDYVPGVYDFALRNLKQTATNFLTQQLGTPEHENLVIYKDRSILHGLQHFDTSALEESYKLYTPLSVKVANRKNNKIKVLSSEYNLAMLIDTLTELRRIPALFIVPSDRAYDSIVTIQQHLKNIIDPDRISVAFRLENSGEGAEFNQYIRTQKINNKFDINTEIVYTLDNKVPKPLLNSEWTPETIVVFGRSSIPGTRKVIDCFSDRDLIIFYEDQDGPSTRFFFDNHLETV